MVIVIIDVGVILVNGDAVCVCFHGVYPNPRPLEADLSAIDRAISMCFLGAGTTQ